MDNSLHIVSGSISDRGLSEKRPQNEDSFLEMTDLGIYAVADGVGGAQAGDVASQMAVEILSEAFANRTESDDAEDVMRAAIEQANRSIYQMALELPQLSSMATTLVALQINANIATFGHVGDSRLYRVDRDGNLYRETNDHSMVAEEVRAGRMTEEEAETHPSRNIISRALGAEPTVEIDLKTMMIEPGTAFLICSDGITRHVSDEEIKGVLTFGGDPIEICEYLKKLCFERGAEDNLTAVVVKARGIAQKDHGSVDQPDDKFEETTIATARTPFDEIVSDLPDNGELLELGTPELISSESSSDLDDPILIDTDEFPFPTKGELEKEQSSPEQPTPEIVVELEPEQRPEPAFSMFGDAGVDLAEERSGGSGKIILGVAMLLIGGLIGLAAYHFLLLPIPQPAISNPLSAMKSENIEFSSFEKNRRNVDADPAAYLKEVPPPEDAEDFYLIGRANILVRDFPNARLALIEAQKRLSTAEPANAKILATDIAIALVITNDPTIQNRLTVGPEPSANRIDGGNANVIR